jgi:hypothetical protein
MSPNGAKSPAPSTAKETGTVGTVNGDMYIADGDYIRDIEVNDLRNRYTLTKGSTQQMVNTPCVISTDILSVIRPPTFPPDAFHSPLCVGTIKLTGSAIVLTNTSVASADLRCVI